MLTLENQGLSGARAIIVLDGGLLAEYVEPAEPEVPTGQVPIVEPEPTPGDEDVAADDNRAYNRADLKAREELLKMEANCMVPWPQVRSDMMHKSAHVVRDLNY